MGSIASVVTIELRPQKAATVLRIANSKVSAIGQRRMNYFQPVFSHRSGSRGLSGGAGTLDRAEGPRPCAEAAELRGFPDLRLRTRKAGGVSLAGLSPSLSDQ